MLATLAARRMKPLSMSIARASDAESIAPPSRNSKSLRSKGYVVELSRTPAHYYRSRLPSHET